MEQKNTILVPAALGIVVIGLIAGGYLYTHADKQLPQAQSSVPIGQTMMTTPATGGMMGNMMSYKDGTYSATGNYASPGGPESVGVTLTLKNGIVTDSTVEAKATRGDSSEYQAMFVENYKSQVIGKSIDSLNLTKVSGSSLTSNGFNDAVNQIKSQAKS